MASKELPELPSDTLGIDSDTDKQNLDRDERSKDRKISKLEFENRQIRLEAEKEIDRLSKHYEQERRNLANRLKDLESKLSNRPEEFEPKYSDRKVNISGFDINIRMPVFKDGDDIGVFLTQFERVCMMADIDKDTYAIRLGASLTGKAAELYCSLPVELTLSYDILKRQLLQSFGRNPDYYRNEFRSTRIADDESYIQFSARLGRNLDYWIESTNTDRSYGSLRELFVRDQIIASSTPELRTFLKERGHSSLEETLSQAENWISARARNKGNDNFLRRSTDLKHLSGSEDDGGMNRPQNKDYRKPVQCFNCKEDGHIQRNCPNMFNKRQ